MPSPRAQRVRLSELELLHRKVTRDGGSLRYLEGAAYGITTSIFRVEIVPGSGPVPHAHPYNEIFILESGHGRYRIDGQSIDAEGGDIVIVPAGSVHDFENSGTELLRHIAIHEGAEKIAHVGPPPEGM